MIGGDRYNALLADVLDRIKTAQVPVADRDRVQSLIDDVVASHQTECVRSGATPLRTPETMVERLGRFVFEHGPLTAPLADPDVSEIRVHADRVEVVRGDGISHELHDPTTAAEQAQLVRRLIDEASGRHDLTEETPLVAVGHSGFGGLRITAVGPPVGPAGGVSAVIRKRSLRRFTLPELADRESLSRPAAVLLWALMQERTRMLVSGAPFAGKSSLLAALIEAIPRVRRTVVVEAPQELPQAPTPIYLEAQEGVPGMGLSDVLTFSLTLSPWMTVIGEVKGAEAFSITRASNRGTGFLATLHANSAQEALNTLVSASLPAAEARNLGVSDLKYLFGAQLQVIVQLDMHENFGSSDTVREVSEISTVHADSSDVWVEPVFRRPGPGKPLQIETSHPKLGELGELIERRLPDGVTMQRIVEGGWSPWQ